MKRIFEASPWYYLAGQYGLTGKVKVGAEADLLRHVGGITQLRFSPDGNTLISIGADLSVKIWDVATSTCRSSFVPSRELSFLATRPLPRYREERYSQSIAVSPDGRLVAVAALGGGSVSIWNLATRQVTRFRRTETLQIRRSDTNPPTFVQLRAVSDCFGAMTFNSEGSLAVASADPVDALPRAVWSLPASSPKIFPANSLSDYLVLGYSLTSRLINPVTSETVWETPSLTSQTLVTDRLNLPSGNLTLPPPGNPPFPIFGYVSTMQYSRFSPSGRLLTLVCAPVEDKNDPDTRSGPKMSPLVIVDARSGEIRLQTTTPAWRPENRLAFSPDDKLLAILQFPEPPSSREAHNPTPTISLRELEYGRPRGTFPAERGVTSIRFAPDGKHLISWRELTEHPSPLDRDARELGKDVVFWNVDTKKVEHRLARHPSAVRSIDISPDARVLITGSEDNTVRVWDLPTKLECGFFTDSTSPIRSVAFSPNGRILATGNDRGGIYLYRTQSASFDEKLDGPGTNFMIMTDLGLHVEKDPTIGAVSVLEVYPDTPARRAGFRPHDVVRQIRNKEVTETDDVRWLTRVGPEGGDLSVVVERDGEENELLLILDPVQLNQPDPGVKGDTHE